MLSRNHSKRINSLKIKKYRLSHGLFIAEGRKVVLELINSKLDAESIVITQKWKDKYAQIDLSQQNVYLVTEEKFQELSEQQNPDGILGVFKTHPFSNKIETKSNWLLVLDGIQDPGNLGTIIRTAAWFGHKQILCSTDCVDQYNNKVVQAAMGATANVECIYEDLPNWLKAQKDTPIYGTTLEGKDYALLKTAATGCVIIGSESHGISEPVKKLCTQLITIPGEGNTESLNASVAAAIVMSSL